MVRQKYPCRIHFVVQDKDTVSQRYCQHTLFLLYQIGTIFTLLLSHIFCHRSLADFYMVCTNAIRLQKLLRSYSTVTQIGNLWHPPTNLTSYTEIRFIWATFQTLGELAVVNTMLNVVEKCCAKIMPQYYNKCGAISSRCYSIFFNYL